MEVKKLNRLKVVMAEKDLSNTWLSERLGVSQAIVLPVFRQGVKLQ